MTTETYTALASTTLGSAASSVTFSNIDQSYGDLILVFNGTTSTTSNAKVLVLNPNSTGTSGFSVNMFVKSGSPSTDTATQIRIGRLSGSTGRNLTISQIMDYSSTDKHKTILSRSSGTSQDRNAWVGAARWPNTSAITSFVLTELTGSDFATGSTFSLYGVEK